MRRTQKIVTKENYPCSRRESPGSRHIQSNMIVTTLTLLGSLGMFLFGMKIMSEALQKLSGEKLRGVMRTMTGNRFAGVGTGFLVTCLVQSSSASTVMMVSFVNAGLLTLVEAIGMIMGANIGTT